MDHIDVLVRSVLADMAVKNCIVLGAPFYKNRDTTCASKYGRWCVYNCYSKCTYIKR